MKSRFLVVGLSLLLAGCSLSGTPRETGGGTQSIKCEYAPAGQAARPVDPPSANDVPTKGEVAVTLVMEEGDVTITMDRANAPCAVRSFESLAMQGYFNDTHCHRLTESGIFVLQCGDPTGTGTGGPGYVFADELSGKEQYATGVVAMANRGRDTNGSQFFMVWGDSTNLPPSYTILGRLDASSLKVVQSIAALGIDRDAAPRPISPARIKSVVMG